MVKILKSLQLGYIFCLVFPLSFVYAQIQTGKPSDEGNPNLIKGYVLREFINSPILGAEIKSKVNGTKAISNNNGVFSLLVQYPDTLVFSKDGYTTLELPVSQRKTIRATMVNKYDLLDSVVISPERSDAYIAQISRIDLSTTPVNNAQDLLRKVGGLFIAQHQGGGKAEQIFCEA